MTPETTKEKNLPKIRQSAGEEIDLLELFFVLWGHIVPLLAALIVGVVAAGLYTYFLITPTYQASSYLYMVSASSGAVIDLTDLNIGTGVSEDYQQLLVRRPVLENVVASLEDEITLAKDLEDGEKPEDGQMVLNDAKDLSKYITISVVGDSRVLQISVVTSSPKLSKDIANEMAEQAVEYIPEIMNVTAPTIAEYAVTPKEKYGPSIKKNGVMGGMVCFILVAGIIVVGYLMDDTIKSEEDFEKNFGIVPLAVVPEGAGLGDENADDTRKGRRKKKKKADKEGK